MLVYIEDIQQNMTLSSGVVQSYARLKLPSGKIIAVPLDEEQLMEVMEASVVAPTDAGLNEVREEYVQQQVEMSPEPGEEQTATGDLVRWADLPSTALPDSMKQILQELGAAPEMPHDALVALVDDISERMIQQAAGGAAPPAEPPQAAPLTSEQTQWPQRPQAPAPPPQQPQQQQVGRVVVPQAPRMRTVPKNEQGYPVVPGLVDSDPGEVALAGGDEDGVGTI